MRTVQRTQTRATQTQRISPRLVAAGTILMMSSDELRQRLEEETALNPALEMVWDTVCPTCGRGLSDGACWFCRNASDAGAAPRSFEHAAPLPAFPTPGNNGDDPYNPLENAQRPISLQEHVLRQAGLVLGDSDRAIAEYLVADLSDDGLIESSPESVAEALGVSVERVCGVLSGLQSLDPSGICARSSQESLLIQLRELARERPVPEHIDRILTTHWRDLANHAYSKVARTLGISAEQVEGAVEFIRENLYPYPGRLYHPPHGNGNSSFSEAIRPDVVIRRELAEYIVEVLRPFDFELRVSEAYQRYCASVRRNGNDSPEQRMALEQYRRATWLVHSLSLREQTLREITEYVAAHQRPFLDTELEHKLKPMTRTEVADHIKKHASTVSRATTNKYVLLPSRNLVPFDKLFAPAAAPKTVVAELLADENPDKPLTDEQIRRILRVRGFDVARRTVAKYRLALGMPSSNQRGRH